MGRYSLVEDSNVVLIMDNMLGKFLGNGKEQELICGSLAEARSIINIMVQRVGA
jgi:hypothetical protein